MTIKRIHTVGFYNHDNDSVLVGRIGPADSQQYDVAIAGEWKARITATVDHGVTVLTGMLTLQQTHDIFAAMFRDCDH